MELVQGDSPASLDHAGGTSILRGQWAAREALQSHPPCDVDVNHLQPEGRILLVTSTQQMATLPGHIYVMYTETLKRGRSEAPCSFGKGQTMEKLYFLGFS